ncbi:MAG: DUF2007 domain-containing protein [Myxococcota bacterium]
MSPKPPPQAAWVRVFKATGPTDAYLIRDWLQRNQVPVQVRGEGLMSLRGDIPIGEAWPSVWVPASEQERAEELVSALEGPTLVHPAWKCPGCAEPNEANFGSCWSCGTDRPGLSEA